MIERDRATMIPTTATTQTSTFTPSARYCYKLVMAISNAAKTIFANLEFISKNSNASTNAITMALPTASSSHVVADFTTVSRLRSWDGMMNHHVCCPRPRRTTNQIHHLLYIRGGGEGAGGVWTRSDSVVGYAIKDMQQSATATQKQ